MSFLSFRIAGEVCFYLTKTREQFRVKGRLQIIQAGESDERLAKARRHQWTQISPSSQASFESSLIPGLEIMDPGVEDDGRKVEEEAGHTRKHDSPKEPSDEFCLVFFWPNCVDHLVLKDKQTRHLHKLVGDIDGGGVRVLGAATEGGGALEGSGSQEVAWTTVAVTP